MLCTIYDPCLFWIPGTGFRRIATDGVQCQIIDTPLEGKTPFTGPGLEVLRLFNEQATTVTTETFTNLVAAVPVLSPQGLLLSALLCLPIAKLLFRFIKADEECRGPDSGRP